MEIEFETLQNDAPVEAQNEAPDEVIEDPEQDQVGGSDPASEPQHDENSEGGGEKPINQEAVNQAINRQNRLYREEQRRREALEKEIEQIRKSGPQADDREPQLVAVDPYDDDIEEAIKRRDESIRAHMAWQERQRQKQAQVSQYNQQRLVAQRHEAAQKEENFFKAATERKIDKASLTQAIQTVGQYQLGSEVASYLMSDEKGPEITAALSKKPVLLAELSTLTPIERILHIERNVKAKLSAPPRASKANPPGTRVKGRAADVSDHFPLTGGRVTFG